MLIYEAYKLLYELIQLVYGGDFQEIFTLNIIIILIKKKIFHQLIIIKN